MDIFDILGGVIGLGWVTFLLIYEEIIPRLSNAFFQKVKDGYRKVETGDLSYIAYKERLRSECQHREWAESLGTTRLKEVLLGMLCYDDFMKKVLSDPGLTVDELRDKWRRYNPSGSSNDAPEVFFQGKGKHIMDLMVLHGYCNPSSFCWIYEGDNSSYLMALFADAIGKELGFGRSRWRPFIQLWGNKNYSDLFEKAKNSENRLKMLERVREVFPDYTLPR
jgi:hypothetical protein